MASKILNTKYLIHNTRSGFSRYGFTLVEILIVIAISAAMAVGGAMTFLNLRDKKAVDTTLSKIVFDLRAASEKSKAQEDDAAWGVRFTNPTGGINYYEVWKSSAQPIIYGSVAKRVPLPSVSFSDPSVGTFKDIIFSRVTGVPTAPISVTITNRFGTKTITVNANGRIDY